VGELTWAMVCRTCGMPIPPLDSRREGGMTARRITCYMCNPPGADVYFPQAWGVSCGRLGTSPRAALVAGVMAAIPASCAVRVTGN